MPLAPGFELILRAKRLRCESIRGHRSPRGDVEAAGSAQACSPHGTGLVIDLDKLSHMSSRFCLIMYHHRSENVDWDVGHSPGTLGPRQRYASRLGCPDQRSRCTRLHRTGMAASTPRRLSTLIRERERGWQPAKGENFKRDQILIDLALQGGGVYGCFTTVCREG